MTEHQEQIERMLRDLASEPVKAGDEFKQRLITTLQQEQRDILQAKASQRWRFGDSLSHWACSRWPQSTMRWALVAAVLVLALVGLLIPWTSQRPLLTIHQGVAQVSSQQPSLPESHQSQGDAVSVAEGARITLDENSAASLSLFNESKVELLPGTQLTLTKVRPRSIWQAQTVHMQMTTGEVQVQVSPLRSPDERFEVDLPAALVSVRGTMFRARVISPQHIYVATDEGVVAVTLHDPSQGNPLVEVSAGYEIDAIIGQPLQLRRQATSGSAAGDAIALLPGPETTSARRETTPLPTRATSYPVTATPTFSPGMTVTTPSEVTTTVPTTGTAGSESVITSTIPVSSASSSLPTNGGTPTALESADLELLQIDTPNPTAAEGVLTYTLLVANHGPGDAQDVIVRDVLPLQVRFADATLPAIKEGSAQTWRLGTLDAGDRRIFQVAVTVHSWVTRSFTNTAAVTAATLDKNPHNNQATVETAITDVADLAISVDIPTVIRSGGTVTYALVYTNFGPAAAHSVTIVEQLAAEMLFGGIVNTELWTPPRATAPGTLKLQELLPTAWIAPKLAAGAFGRIVFTATVRSGALGPLTSTVVITSTSPDSDWNNNDYDQVTLAKPVADVVITQSTTPNPVVAGGVLTYTLTYTNRGPWAAENVFITAMLPVSVTLPTSDTLATHTSPDLATPTQAEQSLMWFTPSLLPGESGTIVLTVTVNRHAAGPMPSQAVIHSTTLDSNPDDNTTAGSVDALTPALSLAQTVHPDVIAPHQPCTYTLHITNTGTATFAAQSLSLVETLPPGFRSIAITAAQPVTPAQTWIWRNHAPLAPGRSFNVSLVVSATETVSPGLYLSAARVTATVSGGTITVTAPVSVRLTLPSVGIAQQVTSDGNNIATSDHVTLTICLTNTGPSLLTAMPLRQHYDPHTLHFVDANPEPEEAPGDGTIAWGNLTQVPPHGIGRDLFPGEALTVTLAFDVVRPLTTVSSLESHVTIGQLRDVYGNVSDGYTTRGNVYGVRPLYLPFVTRSS